MAEERWLSLTGICNTLQTVPKHIQWLVKQGYLEKLPGCREPGTHFTAARYLDPTPQYAERLRTAEMIYGRRNPVPEEIDLSGKALFSVAEIAVLLGWTTLYAKKYMLQHKIASIKIGGGKTGGLRLYDAKTVREMIWRRSGRTLSQQAAPFLISEIIDWFKKHQAEEEALFPSDVEFEQDSILQKKLQRLLKLPAAQREAAIREFWKKIETAKQVAVYLNAEYPESKIWTRPDDTPLL